MISVGVQRPAGGGPLRGHFHGVADCRHLFRRVRWVELARPEARCEAMALAARAGMKGKAREPWSIMVGHGRSG